MTSQENIPETTSDSEKALKPKELIITALVILAIMGSVWGFVSWKNHQNDKVLETVGQEVSATVVDKTIEGKGSRRGAGITVRIYYQFELDGETREVMIQSGSTYDYGTINMGDEIVLCVDPQDLENVASNFEDCAVKLT